MEKYFYENIQTSFTNSTVKGTFAAVIFFNKVNIGNFTCILVQLTHSHTMLYKVGLACSICNDHGTQFCTYY